MSFKMVILPTGYHEDWPDRIVEALPGAEVKVDSLVKTRFEEVPAI